MGISNAGTLPEKEERIPEGRTEKIKHRKVNLETIVGTKEEMNYKN